MSEYITDPLVQSVESTGTEVSITLVVQGVVITGHLTPMRRFQDWFSEAVARTSLGGGKAKLTGKMEPISDELSEEIARNWEERLSEMGADDDEAVSFNSFALRNATVQAGVPMNWNTCPYLLVSSRAVSSFTLGFAHEAE